MSSSENSWPCSVRSEESFEASINLNRKSGEGGQPRVQGGTFAARLAVTMKSAPRRGPTGLRAHPDLGRTRPPCRRATAQGRPASLLEGRFAREAARFHASRRRSAERACTSNGSERGEVFFAKSAARRPEAPSTPTSPCPTFYHLGHTPPPAFLTLHLLCSCSFTVRVSLSLSPNSIGRVRKRLGRQLASENEGGLLERPAVTEHFHQDGLQSSGHRRPSRRPAEDGGCAQTGRGPER